ncbi:unnamed protein product [Phaeothamnion confervicola]
MRLEAVAAPAPVEVPFSAGDVARVMTLRGERNGRAARDFYLYARAFWEQFTEISPVHRGRAITIFGVDERGQHRCVTTFVRPARAPRWLDSPRHAARFVSLLPFERRLGVGGRRLETWHSPHAFLARGRGDVEDHAILLCCLLQGFGLAAYVCTGTATEGDDSDNGGSGGGGGGGIGGDGGWVGRSRHHVWVATLTGAGASQRVVFWESLTGQRYQLATPGARTPATAASTKARRTAPGRAGPGQSSTGGARSSGGSGGLAVRAVAAHHFRTVSAMFNGESFLANKQDDDRISRTLFDLGDARLWKRMDPARLAVLPADNAEVVLMPPTVDPVRCAEAVEMELRALVAAERDDRLGLTTLWDDSLAALLQPALAAYEAERVAGVSYGGEEFEDSVRRAVPEGFVFKGFPTCFSHPFPHRMFESLVRGPVSGDILKSSGDHTRFAVRARVFPYADRVLAVWVFFAVRYQPTHSL